MATEKKKSSPPFEVEGRITKPFYIRTVTLNFNDPEFEDNVQPNDLALFSRRVDTLARTIQRWAKEDGVALINLQEITGKLMKGEDIRSRILHKLPSCWTSTGLMPKHGDVKKCRSLMTLWNASVLHISEMKNYHFSDGYDGLPGVMSDKWSGTQVTANALITVFNFTIPEDRVKAAVNTTTIATTSLSDPDDPIDLLHRGGRTIDSSQNLINVNIQLPEEEPFKVRCLSQLGDYVDRYDGLLIHITGDMNTLAEEEWCENMLIQLTMIGRPSCWVGGSGKNKSFLLGDSGLPGYVYKSYDGQRKRTGTYIGTRHILKNVMKLLDADTEPDKYAVWCRGDATEIKKTLDLDVLPLDWVVVINPDGWESDSVVFDLQDLEAGGQPYVSVWKGNEKEHPDWDWGTYLSTHLPVMTTLRWKIPTVLPYKKESVKKSDPIKSDESQAVPDAIVSTSDKTMDKVKADLDDV